MTAVAEAGPRASGTFGSLRVYRNFRLYFTGQIISWSGTFLQDTALPWLVLQVTHSPFHVGALTFCRYGPFLVGGLYGGVIADRFDNRRVLIVTQTFSMIIAALLTIVAFSGNPRVWQIYVLAACTGLQLVFDNPSRHALVYQLVARPDVPNAVALNFGLQNSARIVGPALGGVLIAAFGVGWCFAVNTASFLAVLIALLLIRVAELYRVERSAVSQSALVALREATRFVRSSRELIVIMTISVVFGFCGFGAIRTLIPVFAKLTLDGGPRLFGLLFAAYGVGAVAGALLAARVGRTSRRYLFGAAFTFTAPMLALAGVRNPLIAGGLLLLIGIGWSTWSSQAMAQVQLTAPDQLRGRVISLYVYTLLAGVPFGALVGGWLADVGGADLAFAVAGGFGLAAVLVSLVRLRRETIPQAGTFDHLPEELPG
jgi:predicted MFS family arabinose efflux permease